MAAQPHGEPSAVTEVPAAVCGSPSPQELLVFVFLELCCKPPALSSAHAVPALTPALGGPGGRERGGRGGRRCEPGPTTYLVDSLKSSLEGSCSSRSQQASTSWGGTSGTWSSLWGRRERVRPSEQSPGVPPGKEKPTETAPKCFGSSGKSSAGAHGVDFALSLLPG